MVLRIWILFCSLIVALGWEASLFNGVTGVTYLLFLLIFFILAARFYLLRADDQSVVRTFRRVTSWRRFLPGVFAVGALLLLVKGIATPPSHDDGLSYRIPRALHWIIHHHWYWIPAQDERLNNRGTASEWISVPILLFFRTEQLVFVPNWISYLFFPGLIFSIWRNFGASSKVAWVAMWLLPSGFCFALQACNCSNDILAAFFVFASIHLALVGKREGRWFDLVLSCWCIALATGVKVNSAVYGLPWLAAIVPALPLLLRRPWAAIPALAMACLISFFPNALINWLHGAGWTGLVLEPRFYAPPWRVGLLCNAFIIFTQNMIVPLFTPTATYHYLADVVSNSGIGILIHRFFEGGSLSYYPQIAVEQAGLGFIAWTAMAALYLLTHRVGRNAHLWKVAIIGWSHQTLMMWAVWSAFIYCLVVGNTCQPARLICAFYILLLPSLFAGQVFRNRSVWRIAKWGSGVAILLGIAAILCFEANPLIPLDSNLSGARNGAEMVQRAAEADIPRQEARVGIIRFWNQREAWLWHPYGVREVMEFPIYPTRTEIDQQNIRYIAINEAMLSNNQTTIDSWLKAENGVLLGSGKYADWYFVRLNPSRHDRVAAKPLP